MSHHVRAPAHESAVSLRRLALTDPRPPPAGSLAADPPAALYYFTESYRGQDLILPALQAKGYAVTQPGSWAEFRQALAGGEYALAIAIENSNGGLDDPVSTASALSDHLAAGRAAWLVDSKGQGSLPAVFQAGYTGGQNVVSVGIFDPELAAGVETPLSLTNPGSYVALSWGLTASSGAVATATFGDGSAAVVLGNDGRSAMIGFAADSLTGQDGQRFYENLVGITVPAPPAITIRQFFCAAAVGSRVTVTVIATDANRNLVAVSLAWGDGAAPDSFAFGPSGRETAILPHTYAARGLYRIAASATDALGATTSRDAACLMAVYGPADSAKGSGSLASPAGAFKEDASVAGTATFCECAASGSVLACVGRILRRRQREACCGLLNP